jgi:hypothetical protein
MEAEGIKMTLEGVKRLDAVSQLVWRDETEKYLALSISDTLEGQVKDVEVSIDLTSQDPLLKGNRRLRGLQADELQLTFNTVLSILSSIEEPNFNSYILIAFEGEEEEDAYMALLKATEDPAFADITSVSVSPATSVTSITIPQYGGNGGGGSDSAMIGIIVGVAVGSLALIGLAVIFVFKKRRSKLNLPTPTPQSSGEDGSGPYGSEIEVGARDDISTLGDPIPPYLRSDLMADDPTRSTAGTAYDFQKAYRRGQLSVVDTINTESDPSSFVFKDDMTLEAEYSLPKENRFEVEAPAGPLGFVLETSEGEAPAVHSIQETSCVALEVQVGDHLVAVDGEDVRKMEASSVSLLIASKKDNPVRRFVFTRPEVK